MYELWLFLPIGQQSENLSEEKIKENKSDLICEIWEVSELRIVRTAT
jgi:hypothetical protein